MTPEDRQREQKRTEKFLDCLQDSHDNTLLVEMNGRKCATFQICSMRSYERGKRIGRGRSSTKHVKA